MIDIPRTRPGVRLWSNSSAQRVRPSLLAPPAGTSLTFSAHITCQSLERLLYVWAIRHPASGYVQGINDLAIPFFQVFLSAYIGAPSSSSPLSVSTLSSLHRSDASKRGKQRWIQRHSTFRLSRSPRWTPSRPTRSGA